jgi:uncharacterized membrane protein (UPF0127 family)
VAIGSPILTHVPRVQLIAVVLALLAIACSGTDQSQPRPGRQAAAATRPSDSSTPSADLPPSEPFDRARITLRGPDGRAVEMPVYVAADGATRQRGLMDRDAFPSDAGMVFLFPERTTGAFWMHRTRIPLSIAFFGEAGDIVAVLDMEPCRAQDAAECDRYDPRVAYLGALEVNQGFFAEAGVGEGWTVDLPAELASGSG